MTLCTNRYHQVTPTSILPTGVAVSTLIYVAPTRDQLKALLNGFRRAVMERGHEVEEELGMTEENLKQVLFSRNGLPERLILKLQRITNIELVSREQIEATQRAWVAHLFA